MLLLEGKQLMHCCLSLSNLIKSVCPDIVRCVRERVDQAFQGGQAVTQGMTVQSGVDTESDDCIDLECLLLSLLSRGIL